MYIGQLMICFLVAGHWDDTSRARACHGEELSEEARAQRAALGRFQEFVGEWRGVGQPKRGSAKDAWSEECRWAWTFHNKSAALAMHSPNGKFLRGATLRRGSAEKYELVAQTPEGGELQFTGAPDEQGNLVLVATKESEAGPSRVTIRVIAGGDRLLILYERRAEGDRFTRLAEVGMTRKGSGFGRGTNYIECVVTGGVGTIAVNYQGETYYVCCTGCRDYFNDNPAEVLAEYRERKAAEKKKQAP
jgi:hypothetical protein